LILLACFVFQILAIFGVVCGGLYYPRQSVVTNSIMVVKGTNTPVQVSSADFYVDSSGTLRVRQPAASGRHLLQSSAPTALLTSSGDYYLDDNGQMQVRVSASTNTSAGRRKLQSTLFRFPPKKPTGVTINLATGVPSISVAPAVPSFCPFGSLDFRFQSATSNDCSAVGQLSTSSTPTTLAVPVISTLNPNIVGEFVLSMPVSSLSYLPASTSPMCQGGQLYSYAVSSVTDSHVNICLHSSLSSVSDTSSTPSFGVNAWIDYTYYANTALYTRPCTLFSNVFGYDAAGNPTVPFPNGLCLYPMTFANAAITPLDPNNSTFLFNPAAALSSGRKLLASRHLLGCANNFNTATCCASAGQYTCCGSPSNSACCANNQACGASSDKRLKANLTWTGKTVGKLHEFTWEWNELAKSLQLHDQPTVGVIAQEAALAYPEAVSTGADGYLRVNYDLLRKLTA